MFLDELRFDVAGEDEFVVVGCDSTLVANCDCMWHVDSVIGSWMFFRRCGHENHRSTEDPRPLRRFGVYSESSCHEGVF